MKIAGSPLMRFCTTNLWGLDDEGQAWALTYDNTTDNVPVWVRFPADAESP